MAKVSNELKTGVAVLGSVLILAGILYKTGDLNFGKKGYLINTEFSFSGGVKKFAPVNLAGVEVGEVQDLTITYDENRTAVEAVLWIEDGVKIRQDSLAVISTLGLMGEKYVEIDAGSSSEFIRPGESIASKDPVRFEELIEDAEVVLGELADLLKDAKPKISNILTNLDGILETNRPRIDTILVNLEETSEYFRDFSEDIKHHPWKVLAKGKEKTPEQLAAWRAKRRARKEAEARGEVYAAPVQQKTKKSSQGRGGFF